MPTLAPTARVDAAGHKASPDKSIAMTVGADRGVQIDMLNAALGG
jgi:hypothetical protein